MEIVTLKYFKDELEKTAISLSQIKGVGRRAWNLFGDTKQMLSSAGSRFRTNISEAGGELVGRVSKYESALSGAKSRLSGQNRTLQKLQSRESSLGRKGLLERTPFKIGKRSRIERLQNVRAGRKAADAELSKSTRVISNAEDKLQGLRSQIAQREAPIRKAYEGEVRNIGYRKAGNIAARTTLIGAPTLGLAYAGKSLYDRNRQSAPSQSYYRYGY